MVDPLKKKKKDEEKYVNIEQIRQREKGIATPTEQLAAKQETLQRLSSQGLKPIGDPLNPASYEGALQTKLSAETAARKQEIIKQPEQQAAAQRVAELQAAEQQLETGATTALTTKQKSKSNLLQNFIDYTRAPARAFIGGLADIATPPKPEDVGREALTTAGVGAGFIGAAVIPEVLALKAGAAATATASTVASQTAGTAATNTIASWAFSKPIQVVGAVAAGSFLAKPATQIAKKVTGEDAINDLNTSLALSDDSINKIAASVKNGGYTPIQGLAKLRQEEVMINQLEQQIQTASIYNPQAKLNPSIIVNMRRRIAIVRERITVARGEIFEYARNPQINEVNQIAALLNEGG